jgi:hypothetical protein
MFQINDKVIIYIPIEPIQYNNGKLVREPVECTIKSVHEGKVDFIKDSDLTKTVWRNLVPTPEIIQLREITPIVETMGGLPISDSKEKPVEAVVEKQVEQKAPKRRGRKPKK